MKGQHWQSITEELIKLTQTLRENKSFKNLSTAAFYINESLLTEDQGAMSTELHTILKNLIDSVGKSKKDDFQ